jgi:hypothetical protein
VFSRGVVSAVDMYALAKQSPLIVPTSLLSAEYLRFLRLLLGSVSSPVPLALSGVQGNGICEVRNPSFRQSKPYHRFHGSLRNYLVYLPSAHTVKKPAGYYALKGNCYTWGSGGVCARFTDGMRRPVSSVGRSIVS